MFQNILKVAIAGIYAIAVWGFVYWRSTPTPVFVYHIHHVPLEKIAKVIHAEGLPWGDSRNAIPEWITRIGIEYVFRKSDYVGFIFESIPLDAIPMLIYSPDRFPDHRDLADEKMIVHFERIDRSWYYIQLDFP